MNNSVILYGIGGPQDNYKVVKYRHLIPEEACVREIRYIARKMKVDYPNITRVFVMDNRHGLRRDYMDAVRSNCMEGWVLFQDICEREGLCL